MHPTTHAKTQPDRPAYIMAATGETVSYRELDERSNQGAQLFRSLGLKTGDVIALMMENHPRYFEIAWAAQRCGLYYTCISSKLTGGEVDYIVGDCGAKLLITSPGVGPLVDELPAAAPWRDAVHGRPGARALRELRGCACAHADHADRRRNVRAWTCSIRRAPPGVRRG